MATTVTLVILTVIVLGLFQRIDDWKRDWTTNVARLQASSPDPLLRPLELTLSPGEVVERLEQEIPAVPRWSILSREEADEAIRLHLTHTTRLMRFVDDVHVTLVPVEGGTRIEAVSRSRVGKGDLGQNPRNLKELVRILKSLG